MTRKPSLVLVIDASVLRSAGETEHPVSKACRDCLYAIREICHKVFLTPALNEEGKRHASQLSREWLLSMWSRRKVIRGTTTPSLDIDTEGLTPSERDALDKDRHLLEAALTADRVIVTRDTNIMSILAKTRKGARLLRDLRWINPCEGPGGGIF